MFKQTALTSKDSYKIGHPFMLPENMTKGYSNFTPRNLEYFNRDIPKEYQMDSIVWFNLQGFLQELKQVWQETFFDVEWHVLKKEAEEFYGPFVGPNGFNVSKLAKLHDLGYLPLQIKSLPEGTLVPKGVPPLTITDTHSDFAWLPNDLESWLSTELWKSSTSATTSFVYRKILDKYAELTGGSKEFVVWQGHDFSMRGMSGYNDSAKSGAGHLLSFLGTDNLPAVKYINDCYRGKETFVGGSVPATEHAVMCAGSKDGEVETYRRLIKQFPSGVISIVSDTWDYFNIITNTAKELKEEILNRVPDSLGLAKVVFRPDSGDPVDIICGWDIIEIDKDGKYVIDMEDLKSWIRDEFINKYDQETDHGEYGETDMDEIYLWKGKYYRAKGYVETNRYDKQFYYSDGAVVNKIEEIQLTPAQKGSVDCLWEIFGGTTNEKGYKTLNQRVGLIYGDSITIERADMILKRLAAKGYASDNIVFGIGSFTFQHVTRDTCGFAMKSTYIEIDGVGQEIFKDPITDSGTKKSAKGLLRVEKKDGKYVLYDQQTKEQEESGELKTVFLNGEILVNDSFETLRNRLKEYM